MVKSQKTEGAGASRMGNPLSLGYVASDFLSLDYNHDDRR